MKNKRTKKFQDSKEYLAKKEYFNKFITVFGKKTVSDLVDQHPEIKIERILVDRHNQSKSLRAIVRKAQAKGIAIKEMEPEALHRISKNKNEDQGIVADVLGKLENDWPKFLSAQNGPSTILAVDGVTNPANLGMIVRSVAAAGVSGLLLPKEGVPSINKPLLIKAAAGAVFNFPIYSHPKLADALSLAKAKGYKIIGLSSEKAATNLFTQPRLEKAVYVLGNESLGLSEEVRQKCDRFVSIPMSNKVESLNVAAAATLVAYYFGEHSRD